MKTIEYYPGKGEKYTKIENGRVIEYDSQNKIKSISIYVNYRKISKKIYYANGRLLREWERSVVPSDLDGFF